jgi:hypothetical protein
VAIRGKEPDNRRRERALARSGFTEDAQYFTRQETKTDASQRRARYTLAPPV